MYRTLALSALIAIGTAGGLATTPVTASAHPPTRPITHNRSCGQYVVLVRHCGHWDVFRTYHDRHDAVRMARRLMQRGESVWVKSVRN